MATIKQAAVFFTPQDMGTASNSQVLPVAPQFNATLIQIMHHRLNAFEWCSSFNQQSHCTKALRRWQVVQVPGSSARQPWCESWPDGQ